MIADLDRTLEALLRAELPSALAGQISISFLAPDVEFPPSTVPPPALDLFLYDIREDRDLRSAEWLHDDDAQVRRPPPLRLACSYLITAWAAPSSTDPAGDEHRLLGEVVRVLARHPAIPAAHLKGSLADQPLPPPAASLHGGPLHSIGEFWQAAGRPKATLACTVTVAVEAATPVASGPPVEEPVVDLRLREGAG